MRRSVLVPAILLFVSSLSTGQQPAKNSEVALTGLHGRVHTVLTETFDSLGNSEDSTLAIYDADGYLQEEYRYDPDGSVHSHTKYTREGWQIYKTETISSVPSESRTFIQSFDSGGRVTESKTYDGNGSLMGRTRNDFTPEKIGGGATLSTSKEVKPDGTASSLVTIDRTSPTGLSHQSASKDGKPYYDWIIERDPSGKPVSDALRFADGSFNERQKKPDGITVEHDYSAPTQTDTYQTTDANNRVVEWIRDSQEYYAKATFRYDQGGRRTQVANYDRSGKLLHKDITKYEDDEIGNWIEQCEYNWDAALGNKHPKLGAVNRRTITYY